jgi:sulfhydrogenase subunit alpha
MTDQDHAMAGAAGGAGPSPETASVVVGVPGLQAIIDALQDLQGVAQPRLHLPTDELTRQCEQAIRNCDPCISCATHFLDLRLLGTTGEHR